MPVNLQFKVIDESSVELCLSYALNYLVDGGNTGSQFFPYSQCPSGRECVCWAVLSHPSSFSPIGASVLSGYKFAKPPRCQWSDDNSDKHAGKLL